MSLGLMRAGLRVGGIGGTRIESVGTGADGRDYHSAVAAGSFRGIGINHWGVCSIRIDDWGVRGIGSVRGVGIHWSLSLFGPEEGRVRNVRPE